MSESSIEARLERMEGKIDEGFASQGQAITDLRLVVKTIQTERRIFKNIASIVWGLVGGVAAFLASKLW